MNNSFEKRVNQIARDICKENSICTCSCRDGHCYSVRIIAERLAKMGYQKIEQTEWNYDMGSCPLGINVRLLSRDDSPILPQKEFIGTIVYNGKYMTTGECVEGDPDYFHRSAIVAWKRL